MRWAVALLLSAGMALGANPVPSDCDSFQAWAPGVTLVWDLYSTPADADDICLYYHLEGEAEGQTLGCVTPDVTSFDPAPVLHAAGVLPGQGVVFWARVIRREAEGNVASEPSALVCAAWITRCGDRPCPVEGFRRSD